MITEHDIAVAYFRWCQVHTAQHPELTLLYHIPNGGHRNKVIGGKLKAEGVKKGVPDYCLPVARGDYHGFYLELKTKTGRPTKDQQRFLWLLKEQRYRAVIAYGLDEAIDLTLEYLNGAKLAQ